MVYYLFILLSQNYRKGIEHVQKFDNNDLWVGQNNTSYSVSNFGKDKQGVGRRANLK
jgi:hypothetical protein